MMSKPAAPLASGQVPPLRRNPDFHLLWAGQAVSSLGSSMGGIVYPLLALAVTRSATLAGVVAFVGMVVGALMRLPSGVLADRLPLKRIMVACDLVRGVATGSIVAAILLDDLTFYHLMIAAAVSGLCDAMFSSAQIVAVRHVVPDSQLTQALAYDSARGYLASLAGQPLGAYLYGVGTSVPVIADACSYFTSAALISRIRGRLHDPHAATRAPVPLWRDLTTGIRYAWRDSLLQVTLICAAGFQFILSGLGLLIIATTVERGGAPVNIGIAFSMGGVGGLMGSMATTRLQARMRPAKLLVAFGLTATVALAVLAATHDTYVAGAVLGSIYFIATPANAMIIAAQMQVTPRELQGRVLSAEMLIAGIAAPLGPLIGGLLLDSTGPGITFLGLAGLAGALTARMCLSRAIRHMRVPSGQAEPSGTVGS
jgi:MFS family permease